MLVMPTVVFSAEGKRLVEEFDEYVVPVAEGPKPTVLKFRVVLAFVTFDRMWLGAGKCDGPPCWGPPPLLVTGGLFGEPERIFGAAFFRFNEEDFFREAGAPAASASVPALRGDGVCGAGPVKLVWNRNCDCGAGAVMRS